MNNDSVANWRDIDPFVTMMGHQLSDYVSGSEDWWRCKAADCNQDGQVNWRDIDPFVDALSANKVIPLVLWIEGIQKSGPYGITVYADLNGNGIDPGNDPSDTVKITIGCNCNAAEEFDDAFGVPRGYPCEDQQFWSRGWGIHIADLPDSDSPRSGYPLSLSPLYGFGPADLPAIHNGAGQSTVPLVSKEVGYYQTPIPEIEQPTQNDLVSLVTGVPTVQETDFELPFGDAVFRHIRTYSENFLNHIADHYGFYSIDTTRVMDPQSTFWDWNGKFWMMGENPILLIDARYPGILSQEEIDAGTKISYLIPDANHAIPFIYDDVTKAYTAPDYYDAVMAYSNATIPSTNVPMYYYVWLNHGTIKYTFKSFCEDVWIRKDPDGNYHQANEPWIPDTNNYGYSDNYGGYGMPYYGLVTNITDRYGNRMEYEYATMRQYDDNDWPDTPDCNVCQQNINEKGQVKAIRLITADNQVAWTILYTYRGFAVEDPLAGVENPLSRETYNPHMVHSIHVYKGDVPTSSFDSLSIGFWGNFSELTSFDDYDAIDEVSMFDLPTNWTIEVKYLYEEADQSSYDDTSDDTPYYQFFSKKVGGGRYFSTNGDYIPNSGYNLLKTTVTKKITQINSVSVNETTHTIYRYCFQDAHAAPAEGGMEINGGGGLKAVFYDQTIQRIIEGQKQLYNLMVNENVLFTITDSNVTIPDNSTTP